MMRYVQCFLLILAAALPAAGHDVWLLPEAAEPVSAGDLVKVDLWQGHVTTAELLTRNERKLKRLEAIGPEGQSIDLPGLHARAPAGIFRPDSAGAWRVIYEGRPSLYRLPAERFERYLAAEGLDHVAAERRRLGAEHSEGREWVSRSLKTLMAVGGAALIDQPTGLPAELILERAEVESLDFRLLVNGLPAVGVLVDLQWLDSQVDQHVDPSSTPSQVQPRSRPERLEARTAEGGVVSFSSDAKSLFAGSTWLAAAVIARPSPSPEAEWRTFFTALTFQLPAESTALVPSP